MKLRFDGQLNISPEKLQAAGSKMTEIGISVWMWDKFINMMKDDYMHPQVSMHNAMKKYHIVKQLLRQMVRQFVMYLDQLAEDLPPKLNEVHKVNLQIHL